MDAVDSRVMDSLKSAGKTELKRGFRTAVCDCLDRNTWESKR